MLVGLSVNEVRENPVMTLLLSRAAALPRLTKPWFQPLNWQAVRVEEELRSSAIPWHMATTCSWQLERT